MKTQVLEKSLTEKNMAKKKKSKEGKEKAAKNESDESSSKQTMEQIQQQFETEKAEFHVQKQNWEQKCKRLYAMLQI